MPCTSEELRGLYAQTAPGYDWKLSILETILGIGKLRQRFLAQANGDVLDVGTGTGRNFPFYSPECHVTGIDLSPEMLSIASKRADSLGMRVELLEMDAEHMTFHSHSFDTVVSSLAVCTFPHPVDALREMARVCKPDGRILLLEHGRSDRRWFGNLQDRFAERFARQSGCHWNREPLELVRVAGLRTRMAKRSRLGIIHTIEASAS